MPCTKRLFGKLFFITSFTLISLFFQNDYLHAGNGKIDSDGTMDLDFNFRFPPTPDRLQSAKTQMQQASRLLCDATEGQVRIENLRFTGGAVDEDLGDIWYLAEGGRSSSSLYADGSAIGTRGAHISLKLGGLISETIVHELGHLAFGLHEQYDEQWTNDTRSGPCGKGPGFDSPDERNNSIMQQATRGLVCAGSSTTGTLSSCIIDSDCAVAGETCQPLRNSEFSVPSNHDLLRGDNVLCPAPRPTTAIAITARLNRNDVVQVFNPANFQTAESTSLLFFDLGVLDAKGQISSGFEGSSGHMIKIYFEHTGSNAWTVHFGIDDGDISNGTKGNLRILGSVQMTFALNGTLATINPPNPSISITNLASGAANMNLTVDLSRTFESNSPSEKRNPSRHLDGLPLCTSGDCPKRWNSVTNLFETTAQSLLHDGDSDWQTIVDNYPFLNMPAGLPQISPPAVCSTPINFKEQVVGTDQVMLVFDRSGSMTAPVKKDSEQTRFDYAQAAARAFVSLQAGRGTDFALMTFTASPAIERFFDELRQTDLEDVKHLIDNLKVERISGRRTGIGTALTTSLSEFQRVEAAGRGRTAFLLSDGQNNTGENPKVAAQRLEDMGIRVFTVPIGSSADKSLLSEIAFDTNAVMIDAQTGEELPPILFELFAQFRGESLVLRRSESEEAIGIPGESKFIFYVEEGAAALNALLSSRNPNVSTWDPGFKLIDPNGKVVMTDQDRGRYITDPFFRLIHLEAPILSGFWTLELSAKTLEPQLSYVIAHVENYAPDCFADALPRVALSNNTVRISTQSAYVQDLIGVLYRGFVRRPDGTHSQLNFVLDPLTQQSSAEFNDFAGRGVYEVHVTCSAYPANTFKIRPGEPIFDEPESPEIIPKPFVHMAKTAFFLNSPDLPPCQIDDCDNDRIPNHVENDTDIDNDGLPNFRDDDADGDEIADIIEGVLDPDSDGLSNFLDSDSDNDTVLDIDEGNEDPDGDGIPNFVDPDSDGDGILDGEDGFPFSVCSNAKLEEGEQCEDGNRENGDGCSSICRFECANPLAGDTNGDCKVNLDDLNNVRNNFGKSGVGVVGDTNGDNVVDLTDLNNVRNTFGS